jgi:SnoaL-like domain
VTTNEELAAEVADLRRRVRHTEDVLAIYDLKARYGELVDQRYERGAVVDDDRLQLLATEIAALFAVDAVWDGGPALGRVVGREAIAGQLQITTLLFSRHLFVKPKIHVDGDRASGRWDILCPCTSTDGTSLWMCGYEDDEYVRVEPGRWLHQSMRLTTIFVSPTDPGWTKILA